MLRLSQFILPGVLFITPLSVQADSLKRIEHAKELMGKYFDQSQIKYTEKFKEMDEFVLDLLRSKLPARWRSKSELIAKTVFEESIKYQLDPIFILAVIQSESTFDPDMRGGAGEIGLMQILPTTGEYIAKKINFSWDGKKTLEDPISNIKLGAAYFSYLREKFSNHSRLYLSAYNMGTTNVKRALNKKIWPKDYASRVMHNYITFYSEKLPEFSLRVQEQEKDSNWSLEPVDILNAEVVF